MNNNNKIKDFEAGKITAQTLIDDHGYSGMEDLLVDVMSLVDTETNAAFDNGVTVVGMEAEVSSLESYIEMEEVASYRATDWSRHNGNADVSGQVEYRENNIADAEGEINELRTDAVLIEARYV